ncbi:conserved Plasmodium protein, unknown function [Plasmodium vinckei vinckei]|uniref:Uncharacterized protein n=1 Tax=Plasmodium vinckei vinckei TaxID=54757 RepID=A0A449BX65_PLAVN|nr:conserved Plasmodium protein, unknown function [Plasmodium vinckei vinckei]KEG03773.1 hypothetical protein YYE_01800 [Plasmodium vinckei vinckei]VEV58065.1 conserved Plasmodium protein, unknown function [Plasmodium vinckei vinckei]
MINVISYKFKKKPPNLKHDLEGNEAGWDEFIKYMESLKKSTTPSFENYGYSSDICIENYTGYKNSLEENIDDVIKMREWNDNMEFCMHPICKESSSDIDNCSIESDSVFNFDKYRVIENNIYSNNANTKRKKIRDKDNNYIDNENVDIKELMKKNKINIEGFNKRGNKKMYANMHKHYLNMKKGMNNIISNDGNYLGDNKKAIRKSLMKLRENFVEKKKDISKSCLNDQSINNNTDDSGSNDNLSYNGNENAMENVSHYDKKNWKYNKKGYIAKHKILNNDKSSLKQKSKNTLTYYNEETDKDSDSSVDSDISHNNKMGTYNRTLNNNNNNNYRVYSAMVNNGHNKNIRNKNNDKSKKGKKKKPKSKDKMEIDGSYAYNYAYISSNESAPSSSREGINDTIMNLDEETKNYNFSSFM